MEIPNQVLKVCKDCGESKPLSEFSSKILRPPRYSREILWHFAHCKDCDRAYHLRLYYKNHEQNKKQSRTWKKAESVKVKAAVFAAYGGYICRCCGETEKAFLTIDHVNNDGNVWRREKIGKFKGRTTGGGYPTYRWLVKHEFPDGFQVLCMNCQFGKRMNDGVCPHQERRNDHPLQGVGPSGPKRSTPHAGDDMVSTADESGSSLIN